MRIKQGEGDGEQVIGEHCHSAGLFDKSYRFRLAPQSEGHDSNGQRNCCVNFK